MKKIKICHFILGFHNGGVEKVLENYFANMDRSKFELHIVTHMQPDLKRKHIFEEMGFHTYQLSYVHGHKITVQNFQEYNNFFKHHHFDIVHNHFPENLLPLMFAKKYGVPVRILHSHNDYYNVFKKKNTLVKKLYSLGLSFNVHNATDYLACGKTAGESVFGEKNTSKTIVITNAINTQKFKYNPQKREELRKQLRINDNFVIGHVGRYEEVRQKNQGFVLKVFKEVLKTNPDARLLMIGEGKLRKDIMKTAEDMGVLDKTIFTGAISNVYDYLQVFDVFLFPSNYEGLPVVVVEAQCSGLPIVASSAIPEETNLTEAFFSLSLSNSIENWSDLVLAQQTHQRQDQSIIIQEKGYDIYSAATKLEHLYETLYQKAINSKQ